MSKAENKPDLESTKNLKENILRLQNEVTQINGQISDLELLREVKQAELERFQLQLYNANESQNLQLSVPITTSVIQYEDGSGKRVNSKRPSFVSTSNDGTSESCIMIESKSPIKIESDADENSDDSVDDIIVVATGPSNAASDCDSQQRLLEQLNSSKNEINLIERGNDDLRLNQSVISCDSHSDSCDQKLFPLNNLKSQSSQKVLNTSVFSDGDSQPLFGQSVNNVNHGQSGPESQHKFLPEPAQQQKQSLTPTVKQLNAKSTDNEQTRQDSSENLEYKNNHAMPQQTQPIQFEIAPVTVTHEEQDPLQLMQTALPTAATNQKRSRSTSTSDELIAKLLKKKLLRQSTQSQDLDLNQGQVNQDVELVNSAMSIQQIESNQEFSKKFDSQRLSQVQDQIQEIEQVYDSQPPIIPMLSYSQFGLNQNESQVSRASNDSKKSNDESIISESARQRLGPPRILKQSQTPPPTKLAISNMIDKNQRTKLNLSPISKVNQMNQNNNSKMSKKLKRSESEQVVPLSKKLQNVESKTKSSAIFSFVSDHLKTDRDRLNRWCSIFGLKTNCSAGFLQQKLIECLETIYDVPDQHQIKENDTADLNLNSYGFGTSGNDTLISTFFQDQLLIPLVYNTQLTKEEQQQVRELNMRQGPLKGTVNQETKSASYNAAAESQIQPFDLNQDIINVAEINTLANRRRAPQFNSARSNINASSINTVTTTVGSGISNFTAFVSNTVSNRTSAHSQSLRDHKPLSSNDIFGSYN